MKHLKIMNYLLFVVVISSSCENDTQVFIESSSSTNKSENSNGAAIYNGNSSLDFQKAEDQGVSYNHFPENNKLDLYSDSESFYNSCNPVMQLEDFQALHVPAYWAYAWIGYVDQYTDHQGQVYFSFVWSIQPNIRFSTVDENNDLGYVWGFNTWEFTGDYGNKVLGSWSRGNFHI